jgi:hypothetical protein
MTAHELLDFWSRFSASLSFSKANMAIPSWKTKKQENYFRKELNEYLFVPSRKAVDGKYILDKKEIEEHVRKNLFKYIGEERRSEKSYKNRPLLARIHTTIGIAVLVMLVPFTICVILLENKNYPTFANLVYWLFLLLWGLYLLLAMVRSIINRLRNQTEP